MIWNFTGRRPLSVRNYVVSHRNHTVSGRQGSTAHEMLTIIEPPLDYSVKNDS